MILPQKPTLVTPPTSSEVAELVIRVNILQDALAEVLEDSRSPEGSENANGSSVDFETLALIHGLENIQQASMESYQRLVAEEMNFSNPPTVNEIQIIIDRVNDFELSLSVNSEDTDNDGIPDQVEMGADTDNDGIFDHLDHDSDNDGIPDSVESTIDTDGDGIANFRDGDSDNDSVFDLVEAQASIQGVLLLDANFDGGIDSSHNLGANGLADQLEATIDAGVLSAIIIDTDDDGTPDYLDSDSDNDGVYDVIEAGFVDVDRDGVVDFNAGSARSLTSLFSDFMTSSQNNTELGIEGVALDTDSDSIANTRDKDSDNDGLLDIVEAFGAAYDLNRDGQLDNFADADGNGISDTWQASSLQARDSDNDGLLDHADTDSDGDGLSDIAEYGGIDSDTDGMIDNLVDTNSDGIDDGIAAVPVTIQDTDNDGVPDYRDTDSNNDGVSDFAESGGVDLDGDGQADALVSISALPDLDADGVADYLQIASNVDTGANVDNNVDSPASGEIPDASEPMPTQPPVVAAANGSSGALSPLLFFMIWFVAVLRHRYRITLQTHSLWRCKYGASTTRY